MGPVSASALRDAPPGVGEVGAREVGDVVLREEVLQLFPGARDLGKTEGSMQARIWRALQACYDPLLQVIQSD